MISPSPALVGGPLAALQFVHVCHAEAGCSAKRRQVGDEGQRAARRDKSGVFAGWASSLPTKVSPASMTDDSPVSDCDHVCFLKAVTPAEFCEIRDRGRGAALRIDKTFVGLDKGAFPHAVDVRPSFVRLQLADTLGKAMHRGKVELVIPAEFREVDDCNGLALRITESLPCQRGSLVLGVGECAHVESDPAMSAIGPVDPFLFGLEQIGRCNPLQDREFEILFAVQSPGVLQMTVVMSSVP
jgi:hypothetical protein